MSGVSRIVVDGVTYYNHDGETWAEVCSSSLSETVRLNHKNPLGNRHDNTFAQLINHIWYKVVDVDGQLIRRDNVKVRFYYFDENEKPIEVCARGGINICNIVSQHEEIKNKQLYYTEDEETPSTCSMQGGKSKRKSNRKRQQRRTKRRQQKSKRRQRK